MRIFSADNQTFNIGHQVEIAAKDFVILTEMNWRWSVGIDFLQSRENLKLSRHVMS